MTCARVPGGGVTGTQALQNRQGGAERPENLCVDRGLQLAGRQGHVLGVQIDPPVGRQRHDVRGTNTMGRLLVEAGIPSMPIVAASVHRRPCSWIDLSRPARTLPGCGYRLPRLAPSRVGLGASRRQEVDNRVAPMRAAHPSRYRQARAARPQGTGTYWFSMLRFSSWTPSAGKR